MDYRMIHHRALSLSKEFKKAQAELLDILQEIDSKKVFRKLGFHSLWDYCLRALALSASDTERFIRVVKKSASVPELKEAVQRGEIHLTAARKICSVINPENKNEWLDKAKNLPQAELEREIVRENPRAKVSDKLKPLAPKLTELHCVISTEVELLIKKVQDLESKRQKKNCSLEETLRQMASLYLEKKDPMKKVNVRVKKSTATPSNRVVRRRIPNLNRHLVNQRDQGRCVFADKSGRQCEQRRFTEIHHIQPYALGGNHELGNLATLCSTHHKAIHEGVSQYRLAL